MTVNSLTFDSTDPPRLAQFWAEAFEAGEPECPNPFLAFVHPTGGPKLMFLKVDDPPKSAKNRCHLDLHADDRAAVDAHVARLVALGATQMGSFEEYDVYWTTLLDPEGNELDIGTPLEGHRPPAEEPAR